MIEPKEALEIVLKEAKVLPVKEVELLDSLGLVLAEDVISDVGIPPFDNSAMDGFAVVAKDTEGAKKERPTRLMMADTVTAGGTNKVMVVTGTAARIMTGATVPLFADSVIQKEDTEVDGELVCIFREVKPGENIRRAGEDIARGERVFESGTDIGPAEIGLLASLGRGRVKVFRRPTVAIMSTGSELVELGEPLEPGKIRNSNTYSLYAQVLACGAHPVSLGIACDDKETIREVLTKGADSDVIVTTGGVSVGDYDLVKDVMADLGAELRFWRVAQKPGKPLAFWNFEGRLIFGLPGNPVATMVCFEEYVRPALRKMMGKSRLFRPEVEATLEEEIKKKTGRLHYVRVRVEKRDGEYRASSTGPQGSGILKSMSLANGLAIIPRDVSLVKAGEKVKVHLIDQMEDH